MGEKRIFILQSARFSNYVAQFVLILLIILILSPETHSQRLVPELEKKTIVLDPGHGGSDKGAIGPEGTCEKDITLTLARLVAARLKDRYTVLLTRADDYGVDIFDRTAVANHEKASVFISLHLGGDFVYKTGGINIITYQGIANQMPDTQAPMPIGEENIKIPWDKIQLRHQTQSKQLAKSIYDHICPRLDITECRIQNAPLVALMGADMPALLIEIGYITNPTEEKRLNNKAWLTDMADNISSGIHDYISDRP